MRPFLCLILLFSSIACASPIKALPPAFESEYAPQLTGAEWKAVGVGAAWNTGFDKDTDGLSGEPQIWVLTEKLKRERTATGWRYSGTVGLVHLDNRYVGSIFVFALPRASEINPDKAKLLATTEIAFKRKVSFLEESDQVIAFELEWENDDSETHALYALVIGRGNEAALSTLNFKDGRSFPDPVLGK